MTIDLQVLADNRDAILLAEVAAWLHDMGKCADEHLINSASDKPAGFKYEYKKAHSALLSSPPPLTLLGESVNFQTLIEDAKPRIINNTTEAWLLRTLGRCHAAAHIEKEEAENTGKQRQLDTHMSTPFGNEGLPMAGSTTRLSALPFHALTSRSVLMPAVENVFQQALGDSRRPENEVTLWDWSSNVAALYKSALAAAVLGHQPDPNDLRWRFLSIRLDATAFNATAVRLPDLLARQELLQTAFGRVRSLLEETYPLGTRVYQDENSSIYVVPDQPDVLKLTDVNGKTLGDCIQAEFASATLRNDPKLVIQGELISQLELDATIWWAQKPNRQDSNQNDEIPPIGAILCRPVYTTADPLYVAVWWKNTSHEICPVCGLRPQATQDSKAGKRRTCEVCEQRRANRSQEWTDQLNVTIWTDEVADTNGRLVLIVGQFHLESWLDGAMVRTLTVTDPAQDNDLNKKNVVVKNPSFARIRRVWETTRTFWQQISNATGNGSLIPLVQSRLAIHPQTPTSLNLGAFHTYELVLNGIHLSVVWDAPNQRFITCDNLDYLAKPEQLGQPVVETIKPGKSFVLEEPAGYGSTSTQVGKITIDRVESLGQYAPTIPILAEPRTFMALVPADKALAVIDAIRSKYEREMGKVRNRLPLHLGAVYFHRRTPLAAALDAGRRMLKRHTQTVPAEVVSLAPAGLPAAPWPANATLTLKLGDRQIPLEIPIVMGDGTTQDVWYPYWQVAGKPNDRTRWFAGADGEHWVHLCDLRAGDQVSFAPATFDFAWLDTTARRFEIAYGEQGQRLGHATRPYLLDDLATIQQLWSLLAGKDGLTSSQIYALRDLVEAKRGLWESGEIFNQLCRDAVRNAQWKNRQAIDLKPVVQATISGLLTDVIELYMGILKTKPQRTEEDVVS